MDSSTEDIASNAKVDNDDIDEDVVGIVNRINSDPNLRTIVCRICFTEDAVMKDLFHLEYGMPSLADKFMFLDIKMLIDDGLPTQICCNCIIKLDLSYKFKLQVIQSENALKQHLNSFNIKEELYLKNTANNFTNITSCSKEEDSDFQKFTEDMDQENNYISFKKDQQDKKSEDINDKAEVQNDQEISKNIADQNDKNCQSLGELQGIILNEQLSDNQCLAIHEHDYIKSQSHENLEVSRKDESKENIKKESINKQCKTDDTIEESVSKETVRRSKRNLIQQTSEKQLTSDEESYFENLNLSSRLKRVQSKKVEKVFFICYWCDKQFLSREILREHMYSHEEVRKTFSLVSKSPEKINKTSEQPIIENFGISGKQPNKCPQCGKEYLYIISYKKHLKQHREEKKTLKESSTSLEVSVHEDEESLDFHDYDENQPVDSDDENKEKKNENEVKEPKDKINKVDNTENNALSVNNIKLRRKSIPFSKLKDKKISEKNSSKDSILPKDSKDSTELESKSEESDEHTEKVESNKRYNCPHCTYAFKHKSALTLHLKILHRRILRNKNNKSGNEVEERVSTQPESYLCIECNKNFGNELVLRNHLITTGHKTTVQGEKYDLNKRPKRVAAKVALKVIDKINTDLNCEDSDEEKVKSKDKGLNLDQVKEKSIATPEEKEYIPPKEKKVQTPRVLFCETCNVKCISKQSLANHMELHTREENSIKQVKTEVEEVEDDDDYEGGIDDWPMDSYECPTCNKKYSTKKSMLRHQLLHEEPNFECDICNVKFYRKDKLKAHYDKCSEKNPDQVRKCNICGDMFENNEILKNHRAKHVADGILTEEDLLEIDPKPEDKSESASRKRRTDIVGLECKECNKQYTSRKGLLRHLQVHEGKKFLCDICPKKFYRREHLKIHVAKHNIVKPYKCQKCAKRFIKEELLNNHVLRHERVAKKPKEPSTENPKRFLCEICPKSFTQSTTLVAHLRAHKGIKPYVCEVCSRPFTTNAYLKMHLRTHTQEKPYICQYCSRAFARADTLANHLTSHTGEAKYHCKSCPKHFRRLKSLKEHVFIHTGQRPYACPTCDRKFNNNGSRYAHSKRCKQNQLQQQQQKRVQTQIVSENVQNQQAEPQILLATTGNQEEHQNVESEVQIIEQEVEPLQLVEHEVAPLQLVEQADLQDSEVVQRIVTTSTGQFIKSQGIKTITIARSIDGTLGQQHVMGQEILMPLILPFAVTYNDVGDEVILTDSQKIFTT